MWTRRRFLETVSAAGALTALQACTSSGGRQEGAGTSDGKIDRLAIARRHNPHITSIDPTAVLSVGNGNFAFNVDCTGLQSLPAAYKVIPLCTMSHWGWHTKPRPAGVDPAALRLKPYAFHGRTIGYPTDQTGQAATYNYMRENPHRLHLGRIGLILDGNPLDPAQLSHIDQTLDLATGIITSTFTLAGSAVRVVTCCHAASDTIALRITSSLCATGRLAVQFEFPYGSSASNSDGGDWNSPDLHSTTEDIGAPGVTWLFRKLDETRYFVRLNLSEPIGSARVKQSGPHTFALVPSRDAFQTSITFLPDERTAGTTPSNAPVTTYARTLESSQTAWRNYWNSGAAIDLSNCTDPRAPELERRIILSQYLMAIHSAGNLPSQETGLLCNSWYGKFHLEMHWWHSVHFALWNRWEHMMPSMSVYTKMLPSARERAKSQGFAGARWVKMTGGPSGGDGWAGPAFAESPSTINPLLIWQQPHPIYYAELCYRRDPSPATIKAWAEIVEATAEFMASFAQFDAATSRYILGPAIRTVPENNTDTDINPTYELTAWRFGLATAQAWRERQGKPRNLDWDLVLSALAPAPTANGLYLAHEGQPTYTPQWTYEHPAMLGAMGALPGPGIDLATMAATVRKVKETWDFARVWGWDFPMAAMAAARTGQPDLAIDFLLIDSPKNRYLPSGINFQTDTLPAYFPGNGGLLAAIALMTAGWQSGNGVASTPLCGFPKNGKWNVKAEGFGQIV